MAGPINVLFVCGRNNRRSPTAERVFRNDRRMVVRAAGLGDTSPQRVKEADLRWANLVLVMERKYTGRLRAAFPKLDPFPIVESLDISDEYTFMQPELVDLLKLGVTAALEEYHGGTDT
jgi:predicted protein tyrosine phosphatase